MRSRWTPNDRLALVDALAARRGADSASFFAAHGLASAYDRPGPGGSKKSKINSALLAAERRGDIGDVLDAARRYLDEGPQYSEDDSTATETSPAQSEGTLVNMGQNIFISHATADQSLAGLLRDTLVLGGVPQDRIFYSSMRATGIPSGEDVRSHLRKELQNSGLVIELISQNFLLRPMCWIELGGAWVLGKSTYPIVVPPLTQSEASSQIGEVHMGILGNDGDVDNVFDELGDRIEGDVFLSLRTATWNHATRHFKSQFPNLLSDIAPIPAGPGQAQHPERKRASESFDNKPISLANAVAAPSPYGTEVHGEATNNDSLQRTVTIKATFYHPTSGTILGTANGLLNQIDPGETKTYTLTSDKVMSVNATLKVQVDTIF